MLFKVCLFPVYQGAMGNPKPLIGAKLKGPGPGRYQLPTSCGQVGHDSTKQKQPAYSFGQYLGPSFLKSICSPGPVIRVNPEYTRHGKDGTARYTLQGRRRDIEGFRTPGPGRYDNQSCHPQGQRNSEKYTMRSRTQYKKGDSFPSPNSYTLPQLIGPKIPNKGASQAYSMTARREIGSCTQDLHHTPGPARYSHVEQNKYNQSAPKYSMLARRFVPGDKTQKPGPGTHYPEHVTLTKSQMPKHSMGIRHSEYITPLLCGSEE